MKNQKTSFVRKLLAASLAVASLFPVLHGAAQAADTSGVVQSGPTLINLPVATTTLQRIAERYAQASAAGTLDSSASDKFLSDLAYWSRIVANGQAARRGQADREGATTQPGALQQRQQDANQQIKQRSQQMEDLCRQLNSAANSKNASTALQLSQQILQLLKPAVNVPADANFKANSQAGLNTPAASSRLALVDTRTLTPAASKLQLRERLYGPLRVAATGSLSGLLLDEAADTAQPTAADTAFDALTQADAAIIARVAELGANPVKIQNWVRNNVRFVPGWGVAQIAASTHAQRQGNAYDIATLLISMLRQAQVPARYVYGTVELSAANTQKWLGTDLASAAQLLAKARIPSRVTANSTLQLEHVWVDAWVSGTPSRGGVNRTGDSWWPLDASFKAELQNGGMDLAALTGLNAAGILDAAQTGAQCTPTYAANFNAAALDAAYAQYKQRATTQLGALGSNTQVGDLLGRRQILAENFGVLLGTQPYAVLVRSTGLATLPDSLRWHLRLRLGQPGQPQTVIDVDRELAALQGKRLTLGFVPETADDATALAGLLPAASLPLDIPAYLVRLKAELRLDGALLASGGSFTLGQTLSLQTDLGAANGSLAATGTSALVAGELHAWGIDAHGQGDGGLEAQGQRLNELNGRIANNQLNTLSRHDAAGDALAGLAQAYAGRIDAASKLFQRSAGMREYRLPSVVRAASRLEPVIEYGIVTRVKATGVALLVDRLASATATAAGSTASGKSVAAYGQQSLERSNAAAHQLLEQTFAADGSGHSALKDLARASASGLRIYRLDASNAASLLNELNHPVDLEAGLAQAAANGMAVLVPQDSVTASGLSLIPVIAQELPTQAGSTGAGSYTVNGVTSPWPAAAGQIAGGAAASSGWLGLMESANVGNLLGQPVPRIVQSLNTSRALLGDADGLRWEGFVARDEVINGIFAAGLNRASTATACDWLGSTLASQLDKGLPLTTGINHAPQINSIPVTYAAAGSAYSYAVSATDADGDVLRYRLNAASGVLPSGLSINAAGLISWASPTTGSHELIVQVDDGSAAAEQRYTLTVGSEPAPVELSVSMIPSIANAGDPVTITALATGGGGTGSIGLTATLDGQPLTLNSQGQITFSAPTTGAHVIQITATSPPVNGATPAPQVKQLVLTVRDPADATPPTAAITSPSPDTEVTKAIPVTGTATDAHFAYYQLTIRPSGTNAWTEIARGLSPVSNGTLGQLDPTRLTNGAYDLGLRVVDTNGQESSVTVPIEVAGDLKLGQFRISFTDVRVEGNGIPLMLTRTYDSTKKDTQGDFGWGWSASANDVTIRKNMVLGLQWEIVKPIGTFNLCLRPTGNRRVTVSMPDGGVYRFQARNESECAFGQVPPLAIVFDGLPLPVGAGAGSGAATARLEAFVNEPVEARGGMLVNMDTGEPWNPKDFKFTSPEGFKYVLREGVGVLQVTDPYGNIVSYGRNGYTHQSSSIGLQLDRDAQGRITRATDPAGRSIVYTYNGNGELASVTDRVNQTTKFDYGTTSRQTDFGSVNNRHLLASITDPRGQVVMRNQFDEYGRLTASADANGQQSTQAFDEAANQLRMTDRRGNVTTYTFDQKGNVTKIVDALGGVTEITYDASGNELSRKDPLGNTVTKTVDPATGKTLTESDALNRTTTTAYPVDPLPSRRQNPLTVTDPRGNATSYGYAGMEKEPGATPAQIAEPLGRSTSIAIDNKGNLRSLNVAGIATSYEYDAKGNRTKETDSLGNVTTYTYDANGNELTRSITRTVNGTARTETTTRVYDGEKRVIEETDASGATRKTTYNAAGKVETSTDALNRVTRYSYDANARLTKTEYPDGTNESIGYDANGNETSRTDRLGRITRKEYDALNRHVKTVHPDGSTETTEFDAAGRMTASIDAKGARQVSEYDAAGQLAASVDASGRRTEHKYDANGNRIETKFADGRKTNYTYDALNRLTETAYPDGSKQTAVYRPDGRKQSDTDPRGTTTTYGYDATGRLISVVQSGVSTATIYAYDETGAKAVQTDALGRQVKWVYDSAGRPISRTLPDGSKESFQYDLEGNLLTHTTFGGHRIERTYDAQGRELTRVIGATANAPARTISFTYDAEGRRLTQTESGPTSSNGTTKYRYDANGRLTEQDSPQGKLNWAYDEAGRITERSTSEGTTRYEYDGDGRLSKLTAPDTKTTVYTYDAAGRQVRSVQQLSTGIELVTERRYDGQDRQVAIAHLKQTSAGTSLIAGQAIVRGQGGAVSRIDTFGPTAGFSAAAGLFTGNPDRVQTFGYDANARLAQENNYRGAELTAWLADSSKPATTATTYGYDRVGNRISKIVATPVGTESTTYRYDDNDRLTLEELTNASGSTASTIYNWDGNGNLGGRRTPSEYTEYIFDSDNRLVEVKRGTSEATSASIAKYAYDADGQRIRKDTSDRTVHFLIDPTTDLPQVALERTTVGSLKESAAYILDEIVRRQVRGASSSLFATQTEDLIPLHGHLSTAIGAFDSINRRLEAYEQGAFGEQLPDAAVSKLSHQFAGESFDIDIGLQYHRERWYDGSLGRFESSDVFSGFATVPASLNRYLYADADPVNRIDPTGFLTLQEQSIAQDIQASLQRTVSREIGRAVKNNMWGNLKNRVGDAAENHVKRFIQQCYKGKKVGIKRNQKIDPDFNNTIDFMLSMGGAIFNFEVKYKMPTTTSATFARMVEQLTLAAKNFGSSKVFFAKAPPGPRQTAKLRDAIGSGSDVLIMGGFVELASEIVGVFGGCL